MSCAWCCLFLVASVCFLSLCVRVGLLLPPLRACVWFLTASQEYAVHLGHYPESFLVRIYGAYNLVVYGTQFRFFAMENLFYARSRPLVIHERWVGGVGGGMHTEPTRT